MNQFIKIGTYFFDYICLNILLIISGILVLPAYTGLVSIIVFYESETYRSMIQTIKSNLKNLVILTVIEFGLGILIFLNIQVLSNYADWFNQLITYMVTICILILLIYPPIILLKMRVSFLQLVTNTILLTFSQFKHTLAMLALSGLMIYLMVVSNWAILLLVPWLQSIAYLSSQAFQNEKNKKGKNYEKTID
jgi:uncharacterized membrane protein YesL